MVNGNPDSLRNGGGEREKLSHPATIRMILADSQAIYRAGVQKALAPEHDIRVVAQVETLEDLYAALGRHPADVVALEGRLMADVAGTVSRLARLAPAARLIVQVAESDEAATVEMYRHGARGVTPRSISPEMLIQCVRRVAGGEIWIDDRSLHWVIEASRARAMDDPQMPPKLSDKEMSIVSCIARGMRNKEIAYQIGTTEQVIKNYLRKIYGKFGVSDRLELALYCLRHESLKIYAREPESAAAPHPEASPSARGKA